MPTILEALAVIKGKDATGSTFDSVAAKIQRLSRAANALNRDVQKQMNMANVAEKQVARLDRAHTSIGNGARMAAGMAAAYGAGHVAVSAIEHTYKASADREHEKVRMDASGMKPDEIADADELAATLSKKYKSLSQTEIMHTARNVRSIVGTFEEATKILDPLMQLRVVALGAHPDKAEELNEDFDKLVKGMEIKGVTQDEGKFKKYINGMGKALNVFGDTLRPTDYYEMFKYGRQATTALSDQFMLETAPTFAQELGGKSTGDAMAGLHEQFVGQHMSNQAAEMLLKYGLMDESKVTRKTSGDIKKIDPGAFVGMDKYMPDGKFDPYKLVNDWLLPALVKGGVTDPEKQQEAIAQIGSRRSVRQALGILSTQQSRIEKDWNLVRGAQDVGPAADNFQNNDPKVAAKAVAAQADNMFANLGKGMMPGATKGMNWFASGLNWVSEQADKHPDKTLPTATWLTGMLSAVGADGLHSIAGKMTGRFGGNLGFTKAIGKLAPMLALTSLADSIMDDNDMERLKKYEAGPRSRFDQLHALDDKDSAAGIYGDPDFEAYVKGQNAAKRASLESELDGFGYNPAVTQGRYGGGGPAWSVDDIHKATGIGSSEPVKAEVVGNATLETKVTVSPSPDFLARVEQTVQNAINAFRASGGPASGSAGSTGRSMPEAGPPQ